MTYDLAVVGAGIVGAATAHQYVSRFPGASVIVLEKEPRAAVHQTGRNSGVIHAGVYYKPGSLKAQLCREGHGRMIEFCEKHSIDFAVSGKLIVAIDDSELAKLDELHGRSQANGIASARLISRPEMLEIEPNAGGIRALHVSKTGVVDYAQVTQKMLDVVAGSDGDVKFGFDLATTRHENKDVVLMSTEGESVRAKKVVVCAGLQSDRVLHQVDENVGDLAIVPFRGAYYELVPAAAERVKSMIYPVPDPQFPFLGVHLTRHVDGSVSCGPNATLALSRESSSRFAVDKQDMLSTLRFPGFWKVARKYWRQSVDEIARDWSKKRFAESARKYLPGLEESHLREYHFGVRAQAVNKKGDILDDFRFERRRNVLCVMNAPSPAATASLAIADYILNEMG